MNDETILYGIASCDTIRKAKKWLAARELEFNFHDFRQQGLEPELLRKWVQELGWETLLNRRGTTWRKLTPEQQVTIDEESAIKIMLENPAIIKRPVLIKNNQALVGFDEKSYEQLFG